jgi:hypothetical protein
VGLAYGKTNEREEKKKRLAKKPLMPIRMNPGLKSSLLETHKSNGIIILRIHHT